MSEQQPSIPSSASGRDAAPARPARAASTPSAEQAERPWYREEAWLAVAFASFGVGVVAFVLPAFLKYATLAASLGLAALSLAMMFWRESRRGRTVGDRPPHPEPDVAPARAERATLRYQEET